MIYYFKKGKNASETQKDLCSIWRRRWWNMSEVACQFSCWRFLTGWYSVVVILVEVDNSQIKTSIENNQCYTTWEIAAAAAAKSLQSCPTLCDPIDGSHQAPLSLGFSRQEHWSGLPFPSLMHGSEKWKWSRSVVLDSSRPHGLQPTRLLHPWDFPGKVLEWGAIAFSER